MHAMGLQMFLLVLIAMGHLALSPDNTVANVVQAGERLQAGQQMVDVQSGVRTRPARLHRQPREADTPAPAALRDTGIRVANAPQATETCAGKWERTTLSTLLRCIDGFWHQITSEQWTCNNPHRVLDHSHSRRTQDACSTP